jgi:ABC-2 family transporter protein
MTDLLRAEWTKLRTVRGWVLTVLAAAAAIVALGLLPGMRGTCDATCQLPVGPGGEEVTDVFSFAHQPLVGDGTISARLASLTGRVPDPSHDTPGPGAGRAPATGKPGEEGKDGLVPWAKAGLIIKADLRSGSAYAAVMATGAHGVRMQYDYTHDIAGPNTPDPVWLRLTRAGDTVTSYASADGLTWQAIGTAHLDGLPATVQWGMFATSPQYTAEATGSFGLSGAEGGPSQATGVFDHADPASGWAGDRIGGVDNPTGLQRAGYAQTRAGVSVTGSGDIAPAVAGAAGLGTTITETLVGTFAGLIMIVVVATLFITAEYRRGLMLTTFTASPLRGRVLAAKAIVLGTATFVVGLVGAAVVVVLGRRVLRGNGVYVHAVSIATELRVIVGTAALLAVAAMLALAIGAVVRRSAVAVTTAVVGIVVPYLLAMSVLPAGAARWVLRVTPTAAFALQQSTPQYAQVDNLYTPVNGYFPLAPWAGFAVLCGWAALALAVATVVLRRRDA